MSIKITSDVLIGSFWSFLKNSSLSHTFTVIFQYPDYFSYYDVLRVQSIFVKKSSGSIGVKNKVLGIFGNQDYEFNLKIAIVNS